MIRDKTPKRTSLFEGMGLIEKITSIILPIIMTFINYTMLDSIYGFQWWVNFIIAVSITSLLILFIAVLVTWLIGRDW